MEDRNKKLDQARRLLESGVITPQEFEAERNRLEGELEESQPRASPVLRTKAPRRVPKGPRRYINTAHYLIVVPVFAFAAVGGVLLWASSKGSVASGSSSIGEAGRPSHVSSSSAAANAEPISEVVEVEVITRLCKARELKVVLPGVEGGGSIVVNYPLDDTDAMGELRLEAQPFICIRPEDLRKFGVSEDDGSSVALVGYTPGSRYEAPIEYDVLMCDELPGAKHPPKNLRVGHFRWNSERPAREVNVEWYVDFRKHVESTCH